MRILSVTAENFASYKSLDFDFTNQGLTVIQGATGSGKSTLCDVIPWVLFGVTAKGGKVDEILSWSGGITKGQIIIEIRPNEAIEITRIRGASKDNDLYFSRYDHAIYDPRAILPNPRGKDLNDTQRLINSILGMNVDLYLAGAYFHEFSQTAQFFTTTAKNRREICEQLVDLSLAVKLKNELKTKISTTNYEIISNTHKVATIRSNINMLKVLQQTENSKYKKWEESQGMELRKAQRNYEAFEATRIKIISNQCPSCGNSLAAPKRIENTDENPYAKRILEIKAVENPHTSAAKDYSDEIASKYEDIEELDNKDIALFTQKDELDVLDGVVASYRSHSISNTIKYVESQTNKLLSEFFDSECQVSFEVATADKLDVSITKDGNKCSYTQLSKGQRGLLKLCFGVSVMSAVQNHHGISVSCAWFDECLDGFSDTLKLKAIRMLETLTQYESVFVVEHSEAVKAMVDNRFNVELVNGESQICQS